MSEMPKPLCRLCLSETPRLRVKEDGTGDMICDTCWPSARPAETRDIIERIRQHVKDWRGDDELMGDCITEISGLRAELAAATHNEECLRTLCADVYQVLATLAREAGRFDDPAVVNVLNVVSAATCDGNELSVATKMLPFPVRETAMVEAMVVEVERLPVELTASATGGSYRPIPWQPGQPQPRFRDGWRAIRLDGNGGFEGIPSAARTS